MSSEDLSGEVGMGKHKEKTIWDSMKSAMSSRDPTFRGSGKSKKTERLDPNFSGTGMSPEMERTNREFRGTGKPDHFDSGSLGSSFDSTENIPSGTPEHLVEYGFVEVASSEQSGTPPPDPSHQDEEWQTSEHSTTEASYSQGSASTGLDSTGLGEQEIEPELTEMKKRKPFKNKLLKLKRGKKKPARAKPPSPQDMLGVPPGDESNGFEELEREVSPGPPTYSPPLPPPREVTPEPEEISQETEDMRAQLTTQSPVEYRSFLRNDDDFLPQKPVPPQRAWWDCCGLFGTGKPKEHQHELLYQTNPAYGAI